MPQFGRPKPQNGSDTSCQNRERKNGSVCEGGLVYAQWATRKGYTYFSSANDQNITYACGDPQFRHACQSTCGVCNDSESLYALSPRIELQQSCMQAPLLQTAVRVRVELHLAIGRRCATMARPAHNLVRPRFGPRANALPQQYEPHYVYMPQLAVFSALCGRGRVLGCKTTTGLYQSDNIGEKGHTTHPPE